MRMMIATLLSSALFVTLAAQDSEKKARCGTCPRAVQQVIKEQSRGQRCAASRPIPMNRGSRFLPN
jgi:hypothetical protein